MWNGLLRNTCGTNVFIMEIDYVKISCKEDVYICCKNFVK
jgi:hypothetical protein